MSFILEALKKSEERRRLHDAARPPQAKVLDLNRPGSRRWSAWLLLVLLVAALAGGWWLRGASHSDPTGNPSGGESFHAPSTASSAPLQGASAPATASDNASSLVTARPVPFAPIPVASPNAAGPAAPNHPPVGRSDVAPSGSVFADGSPLQASSVSSPHSASRGIPVALRNRTPELTISLHFYTEEAARRMVRIDNRIVREGQTVSENLVLEKITPEGAIFLFAGERFELRGPGSGR